MKKGVRSLQIPGFYFFLVLSQEGNELRVASNVLRVTS